MSLARGSACITCRRRKIRCDGVRPVCGNCIRYRRADDCEYTDSLGRSTTLTLEDNIARIEARIRELENPELSAGPVVLSNPYASQAPGHDLRSPAPWWNSGDAPTHVVKILTDSFLPYAADFGFFLHPSRVRPTNHLDRPSSALLSVVCLLGAHLYPEALTELENIFLTRSLALVSNSLSGDHPHKVIHALQAEILLCNYFFRNGRLLEGQYHTSAAVSLAISCALWKIRSSRPNVPAVGQLSSPVCLLPPANDPVEEGERIRGFWTVLILDKSWAVALGSRSHFSDREEDPGTQIDTPWPLDMDGYEQGRLLSTARFRFTLRNFLDGSEVDDNGSALAVHAKASVLFHHADDLARKWTPGMSLQDTNAFSAAFNSANYIIANFRTKLLAPTGLTSLNPDRLRVYVVANTLAYASAFALHAIFIQSTPRSREICVSAALEVVKVIGSVDIAGLKYTNPIVGTLWKMAAQILIDELSRLRLGLPPTRPETTELTLVTAIENLTVTMKTIAAVEPLMKFQLEKVQEAYAAI